MGVAPLFAFFREKQYLDYLSDSRGRLSLQGLALLLYLRFGLFREEQAPPLPGKKY